MSDVGMFTDLISGKGAPSPATPGMFSDIANGSGPTSPTAGPGMFSDLVSGAPAPGASAQAALTKVKGYPDLLHQVIGGAGHILSGVKSVGGEVAKESMLLPLQGLATIQHEIAPGSTNALPSFMRAPAWATNLADNPSQQTWTEALNANPVAGGQLRGFAQTGMEVLHPSRIAKNYSANPVGAGLNDLGTLATVLPGVGSAIHGGAEAAQAARLAEGLQASRGLSLASRVGTGVKAAGEIQSLPFKGVRAGLGAVAERLAPNSELLHAVDLGASTAEQQALTAYNAAQSKVAAAKQAVADLKPGLGVRNAAGQLRVKTVDEIAAAAAARPGAQAALDAARAELGPARLTLRAAQASPDAETALQNTDRSAAIKASKGAGPIRRGLAQAGTNIQESTQRLLNNTVDVMNRAKAIDHDTGLVAGLGPDEARAAVAEAQNSLRTKASLKLSNSPLVEKLNENDLASLAAAAAQAHLPLDTYIKQLGYTRLDRAVPFVSTGQGVLVPNRVAAQLARYGPPAREANALEAGLRATNRTFMLGKIGVNPVSTLNRLGHGVLSNVINPNTIESVRLAARDLANKAHFGEGLSLADKADVALNTTAVKHGAVWSSSAKAEAENAGRVSKIANALTKWPDKIMEKSPFLKAARAVDDSVRTGVWLAARHAGASAEDADYILGHVAGNFDRASQGARTISTVVPFYNWHKQVFQILERMAEERPTAFAYFTEAANHMAQYNEQQGIPDGMTRVGGHDLNLGIVNPLGEASAVGQPQVFLSPVAKAGVRLLTGNSVTGQPTSTPHGGDTSGAARLSGAWQDIIRSLPQTKALQGSAPRYGNGQLVAPPKGSTKMPDGGGALATWSNLLGVPAQTVDKSQTDNARFTGASLAKAKKAASSDKSYQARLKAGQ